MSARSRWLVLLWCGVSSTAFAGMVNTPPVVDTVAVSPTPTVAGASATVACAAHDPDGTVTALKVTVSGGTLPGGGTTASFTITPGASVSATLPWSTPAPGSYTVTCTASDNGGLFSGPASTSLTQTVTVSASAGSAPVVDSLTASTTQPLFGQTVQFVASAHDPGGTALTFAWSTSRGTLTPRGATATWLAPSLGGAATITVTVTGATGLSASASVVLTVTSDRFGASFGDSGDAPRQVLVLPSGDSAVLDASRSTLRLLTARGALKGELELPEFGTALTFCAGTFFVGTARGRLLAVDEQLRLTGARALSGGPLAWPAGLACDPVQGLLFAAERDANRVRALWPDGTTAYVLDAAGADPLAAPVAVAVDANARALVVLLDAYQLGSRLQVHRFGLDGLYRGGFALFGGGQGQVTRGAGLGIARDGRVYVADAFQGVVQVFDGAGTSLAQVGTFGSQAGELSQPQGLGLTARGDLAVCNTGLGRVDLFGSGSPLPTCPNDADCDGLPDAWELANGLDPRDPRDALADPDGDGLTNAEEYAWNTNPRLADTDGDGWSDGEEVRLGFNPLDPTDHRATFAALSVSSDPGLVQLDGHVQGRGSCRVQWTQVDGPPVSLSGASSTTPSFIGRAAGRYAFQVLPTCNAVSGIPSVVEAWINERPPVAQAGPPLAVADGEPLALDGRASWDPNGGALTFLWEQTLGPPRLASTSTAQAPVRAGSPGLNVFALTVTDPAGQTGTVEQPVVVTNPARATLTAVVETPVQGTAGKAVRLDGSDTSGPPGTPITWQWRQTLGPSATLVAPDTAAPSFVPTQAGHYRFELWPRQGPVATVPAPVDVYVAEPQLSLPVASVPPRLSVRVGRPVPLDGSRSSGSAGFGPLSFHWRQVSGPPAGLTRATEATAMVVPFEPGSFVFELVVTDGVMESLPALVRLEADAPGQARPVALPTAAAVETVGEEVVLDGRGSSGAGSLDFRWTQLSGPWVALTDASSSLASFTPRAPGLYVFQLEVRQGGLAGAPATVGVLVFPAPGTAERSR